MAAKATSGGFEPKAIRPPDGALWSAATSPPSSPRTDPSPSPGAAAPEPKGPPAAAEAKPGESDQGGEKARKGWLRRHPFGAALGVLFLVLAGAAGYIYWDYSAHFESTDDAFIAARQFAIAPQVAGYVTAVPVTDNQHVNKGGVIAEIDQRDYLAALAQAEAQVAGAQAGIHNIDAQIATQDAQIAASQAQVAQAQANLELVEGHLGTRQAARPSGLGDGSARHD